MDKAQALTSFWNGFDLPAYDENSVPQDATMPYITFSVGTGSLDEDISLTASLWYYSNSWQAISRKADEISAGIGLGGKTMKLDNGYLWIKRGTPFANRMEDINLGVRRIAINITAEFLTQD